MTRAEADAWAADSVYPTPVYQATTAEAAAAIRREGFHLRHWRFGRLFGQGLYATPEPAVAESYARHLRAQGFDAEVLELRVKIARTLTVHLQRGSRVEPSMAVLQHIPDGVAR